MSKHPSETKDKQAPKKQAKAKPIKVESTPNQGSLIDEVSWSELAQSGGLQAQAGRLGDPRLQNVQRQAMAAQIGRVQGNRHLQRLVTSINNDLKIARYRSDTLKPSTGLVGGVTMKKNASGRGQDTARKVDSAEAIDEEAVGKNPTGIGMPTISADEPPSDNGEIQAVRARLGQGHSFGGKARANMESAFGQDFSDVRVHTDTKAAELSRSLDARAFAIGRDIAFGAGEYQPGTPIGDALLAHELAHVVQQQGAVSPASPMSKEETHGPTGDSLEKDADMSALRAVASIWGGLKGMATNVVQAATPQLMSGLRLQLNSCGSKPKPKAKKVKFTGGNHAMTAYGGDPKAKPEWTPGASDHAVAYTKGTNPTVDAEFEAGEQLTKKGAKTVSVRVKEGSNVLGTKSGIPLRGGAETVTGLTLNGLSDAGSVRSKSYTLTWEGSTDGTTWLPIGSTGPHLIYWMFGPPNTAPLYNLAVALSTRYAAGATDAGAIGDAIRRGLRGVDGLKYDPSDPINDDPLSVYGDRVGICTDYANLLTLLAQSVGLTANTVMFWGGFQSVGKNVWATLGGSYINLINVKSPIAAFNPPGNPSGWAFNYHAISRINGVLQDAALDRSGIDAQAVHDGKIVRLVEPATTGTLSAGTVGTPYSEQIPRKDHTIGVAVRDYGPKITTGDFNDVYPVAIPFGATSPINVPVTWAIDSGTPPPGLSLDSATGAFSGTPSTQGTYAMVIRVTAPGGLIHTFPLSITVNR